MGEGSTKDTNEGEEKGLEKQKVVEKRERLGEECENYILDRQQAVVGEGVRRGLCTITAR